MKNKRILVLGGNGFMGRNLQKVFDITNHTMFYKSRENGTDVSNFGSLWETLVETNPDVIIYAAAHVGSIGYVSKHRASVVNDNTQMYLTLYKVILQYNEIYKKDVVIINPISNCSYPGIINIQNEEDWWNGEIHESVEAYGMPKKMGYVISQSYQKQYDIKTVNVIVPNAYGPNDYVDEEHTHAMNGIIMRMIKAKNNGDKEFVVWGTGSPIREWVYMADVGRIFLQIIDDEMYNLPNPINLGQEFGVSIMDSVKLVKKILNSDITLTNDITKQDGAPIKILGETLFRKYFPLFKFTGYDEGIKNTIEYYNKLIN